MRHAIAAILGSIFALTLVIAMITTSIPAQRVFSLEMDWYTPPSIGSCLSLTPMEAKEASLSKLMQSTVDCSASESRVYIVGPRKSYCDIDTNCVSFKDKRDNDFYVYVIPHVGLCFYGYHYASFTKNIDGITYDTVELRECGGDFPDWMDFSEDIIDRLELNVSSIEPTEFRIEGFGDKNLTCPSPQFQLKFTFNEQVTNICTAEKKI